MLKNSITLFFICLLYFNTTAQLSNYDFTDYKLRNYKKHTVGLGLNLVNTDDYKSSFISFKKYRESTDLGIGIIPSYNFKLDNEKVQMGINAKLLVNPIFSRIKSEDRIIQRNRFHLKLDIDAYYRRYYKGKKYFEIDFSTSSDFNRYGKNGRIGDGYNKWVSHNTGVGIRNGYGRVEDVTMGWRASQLIKKLQESGVNVGDLSQSTINNLADLIAEQMQQRGNNKKENKLKNITKLNDFLKSIGIEAKDKLYPIIEEIDVYDTNIFRNSGSRFSYGLTVSKSYNRFNFINTPYREGRRYLSSFDIRYEKFIAKDKWQINYSIETKFLANTRRSYALNYLLIPKANLEVGYHLNPKVYLNTTLGLTYYDNINKKDDFLFARWNANIFYKISPRVMLQGKLNYNKPASFGSRSSSGGYMGFKLGAKINLN